MKKNQRGSGLLTAVVIIIVLAISIYSVLDLVSSESKFNKRAEAYKEAGHAARSLLLFGMLQLQDEFFDASILPRNYLAPDQNPLSITQDFVHQFETIDNGGVAKNPLVMPNSFTPTSTGDFGTEPLEIIGGGISPGRRVNIENNILGSSDSLAGASAIASKVELLSKATVNHPAIGDVVARARQFMEIREVPLFDYFIFYNVPMEIWPGKPMTGDGRVQVNGDAWMGSGKGLIFKKSVNIAGTLHFKRRFDRPQSPHSLTFANAAGAPVSGNVGGWVSSDHETFISVAPNRWGGNLLTEEIGAQEVLLKGTLPYVEDINNRSGYQPLAVNREAFNSAYPYIQPVLNKDQLPGSVNIPEIYNVLEREKYAYKAGLTIKIDINGSGAFNGATAYYYSRNSTNDILFTGNSPTEIPLTLPVNIPITVQDSTGTTVIENRNLLTDIAYSVSGTDVTGGLYDARREQGLSIIELDVSVLNKTIEDNLAATWGGDPAQQPQVWWNGVVYVEFPLESTTPGIDRVTPAIDDWALKLVNCQNIPNPTFARSDNVYGMALATNGQMYVQGHFNADGTLHGNGETQPDNGSSFGLSEDGEAPAALVADAITFLSPDWDDINSKKGLTERRASDTEVSAAIISGLVPTGANNVMPNPAIEGEESKGYSGGVENLPRFLEDWKNPAKKTFMLRTSIVVLYESEVATDRWGKADVYNAPIRTWGYHSGFGNGMLPPGTPRARNYVVRDLQMLNKEEYQEAIQRVIASY